MEKSNISSRVDGVTKDIPEQKGGVQTYNFPSLGVTVEAETMDEALIKAKAFLKTNK